MGKSFENMLFWLVMNASETRYKALSTNAILLYFKGSFIAHELVHVVVTPTVNWSPSRPLLIVCSFE